MSGNWRDEFIKLICDADPKTAEISASRASLFKLPHLPKAIFKYREVNDYSLANLENDQVWLAPADTFNDPYDSSALIDHEHLLRHTTAKLLLGWAPPPDVPVTIKPLPANIAKRMSEFDDPFQGVEAVLIDDGHDPSTAKQAAEQLREAYLEINRKMAESALKGMQSGMKVCSFCASPVETGLLMWGHYARWHQGFCIKYRVSDLANPSLLHPVIYSIQRFDITPYIEASQDGVFNISYAHAAVLFKHPAWSYEEEWRLFAPLGGGMYAKGLAVNMPTPEAIYLGSKISGSDKAKLLAIADLKNIPVFQMELAHDAFTLIPIPPAP